MICKACKNSVPDGSIFCNHCGERLVRTRSRKKKKPTIPKPHQLKSGEWYGQIMINGVRRVVKGDTPEEYETRVLALKAKLISADIGPAKVTLKQAIRNYIDSNENVLSPSTIRGYETAYRNRFKKYMDKNISNIDYQTMINAEAAKVSPKTLRNAWGLVSPALAASGMTPPKVNLPQVPESNEDWLDYEQIKVFLEAIKGRPVEPAALLALHGLRLSELLDLDVSQIVNGQILIRGATVADKNNKLVHKETNKNKTSSAKLCLRL